MLRLIMGGSIRQCSEHAKQPSVLSINTWLGRGVQQQPWPGRSEETLSLLLERLAAASRLFASCEQNIWLGRKRGSVKNTLFKKAI